MCGRGKSWAGSDGECAIMMDGFDCDIEQNRPLGTRRVAVSYLALPHRLTGIGRAGRCGVAEAGRGRTSLGECEPINSLLGYLGTRALLVFNRLCLPRASTTGCTRWLPGDVHGVQGIWTGTPARASHPRH